MQLRRHKTASRIVSAAAFCLLLATGRAAASPVDAQAPSSDTQTVAVAVSQPTPSVTGDGSLRASVQVTLTAPAEYLEVRLRLRQPSGRLIYQKTEVRADLGPGMHTVVYEHDLGGLDLEQGRYPIEVRVLATGSDPTTVNSRLLVVDADASRLPVGVVVRAVAVPTVTTRGAFIVDPMDDTRLRDDLAFVTQLAADRRVPLALAVPPVLIEQLGRAQAGYETTAGISVPADAESPLRTARVLQALESALETGTIDLVDVPYAQPDLARLAAIDAEDDLDRHWARSDAVSAAVLHSATVPGVAYVGDTLTTDAIASLEQRGVRCVLAPPSAIASGEETATPGCYSLPGTDVRVLVLDEAAAEGARSGAEDFYDALFSRLEERGPVVIMLEVGSGDPSSALAVQRAIGWIEDASWLRLSDLESLAGRGDGEEARLARKAAPSSNPAYWEEVRRGREAGLAYANAVDADDEEGQAISRAVLISESSLFPASRSARGAEGHDGRTFTREVLDFVTAQFGLIRIDAKDVTLSGTKGDVPFTLINDTGKHLRLTLKAESSSVLSEASSQDVDIQPTQNFLTVPIDLGNTLSDTLRVEVTAGGLTVTEADVRVRASYIDRLATIGMVVLVLGGLLLFIRKRALSADAGTIVASDEHRDPGP